MMAAPRAQRGGGGGSASAGWEATPVPALPPAFRTWLAANAVDPAVYTHAHELWRYIRVCNSNNAPSMAAAAAAALEELPAAVAVPWLRGFYRLPADVKIHPTTAYQRSGICGMDVSSGAAVAALGVRAGDHCLDLCCAPGMKLCLMAELAGAGGSVTGVDVAEERLGVCQTIMGKYGAANTARLYWADGVQFDVGAPRPATAGTSGSGGHMGRYTSVGTSDSAAAARKRKRRRRLPVPDLDAGEGRQLHAAPQLTDVDPCPERAGSNEGAPRPQMLYDRVLVDAECTHDGSLKHIVKFNKWGWETFERKFFDQARLAKLEVLQRGLLVNGFRLLKPGGRLVYSTCSFARKQNEEILLWFLEGESAARLVPVDLPGAPVLHPDEASLRHAIKFNPVVSGTSGLFVAAIEKASGRPDRDDPAC